MDSDSELLNHLVSTQEHDCGIVSPRAFAVSTFTTSSKCFGRLIGNSPGGVPRRIRLWPPETLANGWTPERRARQAELIRTGKPWERSTGPKTPAGNAKVAHNVYRGATRQWLRQLRWVLRKQDETRKRAVE